jgi:hypothetical protein
VKYSWDKLPQEVQDAMPEEQRGPFFWPCWAEVGVWCPYVALNGDGTLRHIRDDGHKDVLLVTPEAMMRVIKRIKGFIIAAKLGGESE